MDQDHVKSIPQPIFTLCIKSEFIRENFVFKVVRYSFNLALFNLDKLIVYCSCISTFGLQNYDSFGDQFSVAMATLSYEIH